MRKFWRTHGDEIFQVGENCFCSAAALQKEACCESARGRDALVAMGRAGAGLGSHVLGIVHDRDCRSRWQLRDVLLRQVDADGVRIGGIAVMPVGVRLVLLVWVPLAVPLL